MNNNLYDLTDSNMHTLPLGNKHIQTKICRKSPCYLERVRYASGIGEDVI